MSQENVEIVRRVYERYSQGDFRAAADLLDPHVVLVLDPVFAASLFASPVDEAFYGIEAVAGYTRGFMEDAHVTMEAEELVVAGDSVLVRVHQRVTGKMSGVPTEVRYFSVWSFRGRKVIRIESFGERAEALEAAGLSDRRCRGRTSRTFGAGSMPGTGATSTSGLLASHRKRSSIPPADSRIGACIGGVRGWSGYWAEVHEDVEEMSVSISDLRASGDRVFQAVTGRGRGKRSKVPVEGPIWFVTTLRDGLAVRVENYVDRDEALEAAGLRE